MVLCLTASYGLDSSDATAGEFFEIINFTKSHQIENQTVLGLTGTS